MDTAARIIQRKLVQADEAERYRTYLESQCMESLLRHLEHGKEELQSTGLRSQATPQSAFSLWLSPEEKAIPQDLDMNRARPSWGSVGCGL